MPSFSQVAKWGEKKVVEESGFPDFPRILSHALEERKERTFRVSVTFKWKVSQIGLLYPAQLKTFHYFSHASGEGFQVLENGIIVIGVKVGNCLAADREKGEV